MAAAGPPTVEAAPAVAIAATEPVSAPPVEAALPAAIEPEPAAPASDSAAASADRETETAPTRPALRRTSRSVTAADAAGVDAAVAVVADQPSVLPGLGVGSELVAPVAAGEHPPAAGTVARRRTTSRRTAPNVPEAAATDSAPRVDAEPIAAAAEPVTAGTEHERPAAGVDGLASGQPDSTPARPAVATRRRTAARAIQAALPLSDPDAATGAGNATATAATVEPRRTRRKSVAASAMESGPDRAVTNPDEPAGEASPARPRRRRTSAAAAATTD